MEYNKVDSSMIDLVGYDADTEVLEVRFINTGLTYEYYEVSKKVYKQLMESGSKGSFMRNNILDMYSYSKLKGGYRNKEKREHPKRNPLRPFIAEFVISDISGFDKKELKNNGESYFNIKEDGTGNFHFGFVNGSFQGKIVEKKDDEIFEFAWQGTDEDEEVSGTGYALIGEDEESIEGEICFEDGDEHYFRAYKNY